MRSEAEIREYLEDLRDGMGAALLKGTKDRAERMILVLEWVAELSATADWERRNAAEWARRNRANQT